MNLQEAVAKAREQWDDMVLVAKPPFTWASEARYIERTDEFCVPSQIADEGFLVILDLKIVDSGAVSDVQQSGTLFPHEGKARVPP